MKNRTLIKIGDLAKEAGITTRTLRYYEELGMIDPVERSEGGFRLYSMDQLKKLKIIKNLKALDFELESIKEILTLKNRSDMGGDLAVKVLEILELQIRHIDSKIEQCVNIRHDIMDTYEIIKECLPCDIEIEKRECMECPVLKDREELTDTVQVIV